MCTVHTIEGRGAPGGFGAAGTQTIRAAAGAGLDDLVQAHLYLPDLRGLGAAVPTWEAAVRDHRPAGNAVSVGPLPVPGCVVMLDAGARVR